MESSNHSYNQFQVFRYQLNKLQTYKSSFQAWKCVSFGYALLASVLLLSKWHEVSTDLRLLNGIDQLLNNSSGRFAALSPGDSQLFSPPPTPMNLPTSGSGNGSAPAQDGSELLNEGGDGNATSAASGAQSAGDSQQQQQQRANASQALVSHMQISLSREANGNQVLKQEVETFLGEFKSAKSTLGLSSLLVFVYILSWILMTLAVNDTRISNDVSLRNILLLSVFGAIDMAASIGFVMVRLIMFNARSGSIAPADVVLGPTGLRDAPSGLSSDQLTAFTALRLISMRSCSAYIDIYVSVIVALLTILRLYAIVRAIAYYRFLRRFNDLNRNYHHQQQLSALMTGGGGQHQTSEKQLPTINGFALTSPQHGCHTTFGPDSTTTKAYLQQSGWHAATGGGGGYFSSGGGHPNPNDVNPTHHHLVASPKHNSMSVVDQLQHSSARATPIQDFQFVSSQPVGAAAVASNFVSCQPSGGMSQLDQQQQQQQQTLMTNALKLGHTLRATTTTGQQVLLSPSPGQNQRHNSSKQPQQQLLLAVRTDDQQQQQVSMRTPIRVEGSSQRRQQQHQHVTLKPQHPTNSRPSLLILTNNKRAETPTRHLDPNIWTTTLTVDHDESNGDQLLQSPPPPPPPPTKTPRQHHRQKHHQKSSAPNLLLLNGRAHKLVGGYESSTGAGGGFESEPAPVKRKHHDHLLSRNKPNASTSRANLLESPNDDNNNNNTSKPNSFTLLSASQLDRLSRKLLANATGSLINVSSGRSARRQQVAEVGPSSRAGDKYKLIGRYRPIKGGITDRVGTTERHEEEDDDEEIERMADDLLLRNGGGGADSTNTLAGKQRALLEHLVGSSSSGTSSSGLATDSDDPSSGSPSDARLRAQQQQQQQQLLASRRHLVGSSKQASDQARERHRNSRTSKPSSSGGVKNHQPHRVRASLASLRQSEEFNVKQPYLAAGGGLLSPSVGSNTAAQKRDLLLEKYYYT